jgi:hypothetical protein
MKEALELIKKYGATAVLVLWLWHTHNRVAVLENKLYNCLERQSYDQMIRKQEAAILPKKIEDEAESNS